jgi:hypothetical protein
MVVATVAATYQQSMTSLTWNFVEFAANLAVIAYVLSFFGILRVPKPQGNVAEATATSLGGFSGFGNFVSEATTLAKNVNSAMTPAEELAANAAKTK